ncbi:LysR family transcriptional regulator [Bordetella avium]|uniref:LysR family transcriptional regulator n=1 Tax=Bordetella avium TaxID=521 RepID=UPI000FDCC192|nr:LysR family transcriptional regulator [Bordetella avium]AZY48951.1 LysR family transcriptional regulator [Bordetella avium]
MNVTPRQLRIFLALAESLNFSRTAEQFFITQPSLSKAVKDMEEALNVALFERTTRTVRLTPAGQRMTSLARRVIGEFDHGLQQLQSLTETAAHHLSIAAIPSMANAVLPDVCAKLESDIKAIRLTIYDGTNAATIQRLVNYQVDFALASAAPSHPDLEYEEVMRDRFALLAPAAWSDRVRPRMRMDELIALPLISGTDASTAKEYVSAAFLQRGIVFRPKLSFDQVATAAGFVRRQVGIAIQPFLGVLPLLDLRGMTLCQIEDGPIRSVGIVRRKASHTAPLIDQAMHEVRRAAALLIRQYPEWIHPPAAPDTPSSSV